MRHDRLRAVAQFRGQQVNSDLGEGFAIHKMISLSKLHENLDIYLYVHSNVAMVLGTLRRKPSQKKGCIDAIIPGV